jgi:two-component system nitrogen regulation response regulator GlnG
MSDLLLIDDDPGQLVTQVRPAFPAPGHRIAEARTGAEGVARAPAAPPDVESGGRLVGTCPAMRQVYKEIGLVAGQDFPVIITVESGTGKELVARAIHEHSGEAEWSGASHFAPAGSPADKPTTA